MQLLNVDQKRHIQDKEDLIKMKLEIWLSNIYCFGRIKPKFKYRTCLIDIKYAYIISVDTHFTYVFHDYLQLELIFFFFFSKIKDNNKQALLLKSISYINVPYINQQIFFYVYRSTCIFCLQSILWFLFNVFSLSPPRTFCNQVLLTHSLVLSSLQYRMVVENRKEPNKLK